MEAAEDEENLPGSVLYEKTDNEGLYPSLELAQKNETLKRNSQEIPSPPSINSSIPGFNFWDVNAYKRTVKRIDDGAKLCDDLLRLLAERAEIEGLYVTKLQGWSKKWNDLISKGSEYGSLKNTWVRLTDEADQIASIHSERQVKLLGQVHGSVLEWKSANYHKSLLSWKETKAAEEGFSKAQKPWTRRYDEVLKCKRAYYQACKARDQAERMYKEASVEGSTVTEEQVKKLKDKADKTTLDVQTTKDKYQEGVRDITNYNPKYVEDMSYVFNKCQESEKRRKNFFKETCLRFCQQMELSKYYDKMSGIYGDLVSAVEAGDVSADISWWATNFGSDMPTRSVEFEEYVPGQDLRQTAATTIPNQQRPAVTAGNTLQGDVRESPGTKKSTVCATL